MSLILGAAAGVALADARGGSLLAGAAIGAFTGSLIVAATQYAHMLLQRANGDLQSAFDLSQTAANTDLMVFRRENVPLILAEQRVVSAVETNSSSIRASEIDKLLSQVDEAQRNRTIPLPFYSDSAKTYGECNQIMPNIAGVQNLLPPQDSAKQQAQESSNALRNEVAIYGSKLAEVQRKRQALMI